MLLRVRSSVLAFSVLVVAIGAQDPVVSGGPLVGAELPALAVYGPAGPHAGLECDLAELAEASTAAILIVPELTRNVAPLVRGLDELGDSHAPLNVFTATAVLAADRTEAERRLVAASRSLRLSRPMLLVLGGVEAGSAWSIDPRATATLVIAKAGIVRTVHAFTDTNRDDVARVRTMVEAVSGPLPKSPGELRDAALANLPKDQAHLRAHAARLALELHWRQLRMQEEATDRERRARENGGGSMERMRPRPTGEAEAPAPTAESRRGRMPTDPGLRESLRAALAPEVSAQRLDEIFAGFAARARESAAAKAEVIAMLELVLATDRGSPALRAHAETAMRQVVGR
ncbi:MAG: hypothetical protein AB7I19_14065 [Planctomycetota bacterium]